jgi:hypothetical protein
MKTKKNPKISLLLTKSSEKTMGPNYDSLLGFMVSHIQLYLE